MVKQALTGLWEFIGLWDEARGGPRLPTLGTSNSELREFLFFDPNGTFFFAKYPRDKTIYFEPDTRRFICAEVRTELLNGKWQLEGDRLIESVFQRGETSERQQSFELEELSKTRLIIKEPAGDGTKFLKAVYARGDVESFPAPPLPDAVREETSDQISDVENDYDEHVAQLETDLAQIESLDAAGKLNSAQRLAQLSVQHSERVFGASDPNTASCLCTLGACLVKLNESESAIKEMERARRIFETHFGPGDLMTARALNNLAPAYRNVGEFRAAIEVACDAVRIRLTELGGHDISTATSFQNLGLSLSGLGLLPEALRCYFTAEGIFKSALGPRHPRTRGALQNIQRLAEAIKRDPRFEYHSLPMTSGRDYGIASVQKILDMCDQMLKAQPASDLFTLAYGRAAHLESYSHLIFEIRNQERLIATRPADLADRVLLLRDAQRRIRASLHAPVGKFSGFLKRVDRSKLGPKSQAALEHVFPNFGSDAIEKSRQRDEEFKQFGIDPHATPTFTDQKRRRAEAAGFKVKLVARQFRRYAGENNLPSQRYSSVCLDASGDDSQTLCRELFEYTDPRVPGLVFVADTADAELMAALTGMGMAQPKVPGIFVFVLPPVEDDERRIFRHFIGPLLTTLYGPYDAAQEKWEGLSIVFMPTELVPVEIDEVMDLRQPATQEWLFRFFKNGDGAVWVKTAETEINSFAGMLPSLVYPEYGGSGVTKSMGSWVRSVGVQGLIFPSARSDAAIEVDNHGVLQSFHGWNFVDYRGTELVPDQLVHFDNNDWYGFVAGRQAAPSLQKRGKSWAIEGVEERYNQAREFILNLLAASHF